MQLWGHAPVEVTWDITLGKPHQIKVVSQRGQMGHTLTLFADGQQIFSKSINDFTRKSGAFPFRYGKHALEFRWMYPEGSSDKPSALALLEGTRRLGVWGDTGAKGEITAADFATTQGAKRRMALIVPMVITTGVFVLLAAKARPGDPMRAVGAVGAVSALLVGLLLYYLLDWIAHRGKY